MREGKQGCTLCLAVELVSLECDAVGITPTESRGQQWIGRDSEECRILQDMADGVPKLVERGVLFEPSTRLNE